MQSATSQIVATKITDDNGPGCSGLLLKQLPCYYLLYMLGDVAGDYSDCFIDLCLEPQDK